MEGSLIRLAVGDNWDFTNLLAFSWYTCTHDSTYKMLWYWTSLSVCYGMDKFTSSLKNGIPLYPFHFNNGVSSIKFSASHYGIIHGLHCTYAYSWKGPGLVVIENCLLSMDTPPKDGLPHVEV